MRIVTPLLVLAAGLALTALAGPANASFRIDDFSDVFPPNDCLLDTHAPIVFLGRVCDGPTCPPASMRFSGQGGGCEYSQQPSLPGVVQGGSREVILSSYNSMLALEVLPASHELEFRWGPNPYPSSNYLYYQWPDPIDFQADAIDRLKLELNGDITPTAGVLLEIHLSDSEGRDWGTISGATGPGVLELPLAEWTNPGPGFDFRHVTGISLDVTTCGNCVGAGSHPAGTFRLGPPFMASALPTHANRRSWGQVKSIYR